MAQKFCKEWSGKIFSPMSSIGLGKAPKTAAKPGRYSGPFTTNVRIRDNYASSRLVKAIFTLQAQSGPYCDLGHSPPVTRPFSLSPYGNHGHALSYRL